VILISAFEEGASIREAVEAGAVGFVPKRVAPEELLEAVRTAARGELILTADLAAILANAANRPALSERERQALSLYASGLTVAEVAAHMGVSPHTAKEYIDRVRDKYTAVGRRARTRTELYAEASKDGMLE
jgi:DNA-binding NarL/FixJ family response regulator